MSRKDLPDKRLLQPNVVVVVVRGGSGIPLWSAVFRYGQRYSAMVSGLPLYFFFFFSFFFYFTTNSIDIYYTSINGSGCGCAAVAAAAAAAAAAA